ncbi:hypothetical protein [Actinophytocola oryzae]|uniref:DUF998 domain-containing protein n=1 Tax=Actinophytocola oryzae TaxID=502181 RepID=A0A4R7W111_9PSEU|nr:hypothetical protein [Actinophytocola oryzae]TDV55207.1 hypothetical protein CLV71_103448 [Actinophytocola oryzae]
MYRNALGLAGVLFLLYPVLRPWTDETTTSGAHEAMSSNLWVVAHFAAMIGFVLVPLALLGLRDAIGLTPVAVMWVGAGLTLPYYGAEDFGLHAAATNGTNLLDVVDATRYNPVAITIFGVGLVMLAVGAVLVAIPLWRAGAANKYAAVVFAAGFVLFLPQFFAPEPVRIAHGVLVLVGLVWLALTTSPPVRTPHARLRSQSAA